MPMPKPQKVEDISVNGRTPKTLDIKVVKVAKDIPDVRERMAELAEKAKAEGT